MSNRSDVSPSRGRFLGTLGQIFKKKEPESEATPMILGKEGNFKYDPIKKKYIFLDEPEQEDEDIPKPPPKAAPKQEQQSAPQAQAPSIKQESVQEDLCKPAGHLALHRMKRNQPQPAQTKPPQAIPQQHFVPNIPKIEVNRVEEQQQVQEEKNQDQQQQQNFINEDHQQEQNDLQLPKELKNQQQQQLQFLRPEPQSMAEVSFDTKQQSSPPVSKQRSCQTYDRENIVREVVDQTYQQIIQINIPPPLNGRQHHEINLNQFINLDHHYYPEEVNSEPLSLTSDFLRAATYVEPVPVASYQNLFQPQSDDALDENLQYLRKAHIQNYQSAIQDLLEENDGCYVIIQQLTKELNLKGQIVEKQNQVIQELISKLHEFSNHYETVKQILYKKLKPQLDQFKEEKLLQTKQKQALQNQLFEVQIELKNSRKECEFYQEQYKHQLKERSSYQKYYEEIRKEMQEDITNLTQKLEESKIQGSDVHALEIENHQLRSELELLKSEYEIYQKNQSLILINYQSDIKETIEQDLRQLKNLFNISNMNVELVDASSLEIRKQLFQLQKVLVKQFQQKEIDHNQQLDQLKQQLSSSHNQSLQAQRNLLLLQQQIGSTDKIFQQIKAQLEYKLNTQTEHLSQLQEERNQLKQLVNILKKNQQEIQDILVDVTTNHYTSMSYLLEQLGLPNEIDSQKQDQIQKIIENFNFELSQKNDLQTKFDEVEQYLTQKTLIINQQEEKIVNLEEQLNQSLTRLKEEEIKSSILEEKLNQLQNVLEQIQDKYDDLEVQQNQHLSQISHLNQINEQLEEKVKLITQEKQGLEKQIQEQSLYDHEHQSQIQDLQDQLIQARKQFEDSEQAHTITQNDLVGQSQKYLELENQLKCSLQGFNEKHAENEQLIQSLKQNEQNLNEQENELRKLNEQVEQLKNQNNLLRESNDALTSENQILNQRAQAQTNQEPSQEFLDEFEGLNQSLAELIQQNKIQQDQISDLNELKKSYEGQINTLSQQVQELQTQNVEGEAKIGQLASELENYVQLLNTQEEINQSLKQQLNQSDGISQEETLQLRGDQAQLRLELQEVQQRNQILQSQLIERDDKLEQLINLVEELNQRPDEKEQLRETLSGYEQVIAELQERLQSVNKYQFDISLSENQYQELESLKQLYQQKLQVISVIQDENTMLKDTISELQKFKVEYEQNELFIEQLVQEKASLLKQLDQAQNESEYYSLLRKNELLMETVTNLEAERRTLKDSMDGIIRSQNQELQKLQLELKETQDQTLQFKAQRDECMEQIKYYESKLTVEKQQQQSGGLLTKFAGFFVTESEMKKFAK